MQHDIGLLHKAKRPKGQQVRIAGARAHQIDLAHRALLHRARKRCLEVARRNVLLAGKHAFRNAAVEDVFPEDPSRRADRQAIFNHTTPE